MQSVLYYKRNQVYLSFPYCDVFFSQCIASTTLDEHRLHFDKDKALARRFQPVLVNEPSQVIQISISEITCLLGLPFTQSLSQSLELSALGDTFHLIIISNLLNSLLLGLPST